MLLSSSLSLYLKFFVTVFYLVFFGAFTVALWLSEHAALSGRTGFKITFTVMYFIGVLIMYRLFRLMKRVDIDDRWLYVTDYFRGMNLRWEGVKFISIRPFIGPYRIACIHTEIKTPLGRRICFLTNTRRLKEAAELYPPFQYFIRTKWN